MEILELKVLPAALAADPDRMARFEREARVLAALDHPNIAVIYGLAESYSLRAFVMAAVIKEEPKLDAAPEPWRAVIARCLNKDPRQRLQVIGEARIALENPVAPAPGGQRRHSATSRSRFRNPY